MIEQRKLRYLLTVVILLLALIPCTALADDYEGGGGGSHNIGGSYPNFGTVWFDKTAVSNGLDVSPIRVRYGVVAFSNWDAAMYCLRGTSFSDSELTNVKKNKLLADSDFRSFANLFAVGKPEATNDWSGDASITLAWNSARELYGETYCYSVIYTMDQWYAADAALGRIMQEDDGPGEAPVIDVSGFYTVTLEATNEPYSSPNGTVTVYDNPTSITVGDDGKGSVSGGSSGESIKWSNTKYIYAYIDPYSYNLLTTSGFENLNCIRSFGSTYCITSDNVEYEFYELEQDSNYGIKNTSEEDINFKTYESANTRVYRIDGKICIFFTNIRYSRMFALQPGGTNSSPLKPFWTSLNPSVDTPTDPPTTWPDPPTTPIDPPTVPDPPTPTPPTPWDPILPIGIEITGEDFQDLLDALDEHCKHLQKAIQDNISQLWDLQSELISSEFADLKDYLNDLFNWLAERMNFNVNYTNGQYDDTSVIYWLKQIWSKLGSGINTRPTDPVTNPTGWWDWLTQLLNNLAADLMALGHDKLAGVLEMLNQLRNKFPFSLPWDIAALLGLLVAVPECPEFDVPVYALGSNMELAEVGSYHITLEPYEDVWEGVKWIETLAFAVYLITHTSGLMDMVSKTVRPR